jgi:DNA end-binding protein Ku
MPRPIWSGAVTFGLVTIPVKLVSAVHHKEVRFHLVHDADGGRIHIRRVCSVDGKEVPYEHVARGYEVGKGQYVVFKPEELARLDAKAARVIEIERFVDLKEIDPIFYDATYHLVPDRFAARAYALLNEVMAERGKAGLGRIAVRARSSMCAVRPMEGGLSVSTLLYADEVVHPSTLGGLPKGKPNASELKTAEQLIDAMSAPFQPEKFKDEYRERVLEMVDQKARGKRVVTAPVAEKPTRVGDLMDALRKSLATTPKRAPARHRRRSSGTRKSA